MFPDDYQFACLDKLLEVITTDLDPAVNSNHIFICLMKRLENFSKENQSTITTTYEQFYNVILSIVERASSQEVKNILILLVSFLNYSVKAFHSIE